MKKIFYSLFFFISMMFVTNKSYGNVNVIIAGVNPPSQQFIAGQQNVMTFGFYMSRQGADSIVTSMSFILLGSDDVGEFYFTNQGTPIGSGRFVNGQLTLSNLHISLQQGNAAVFINVNINANTNTSSFSLLLQKLSTVLTPVQNVGLVSNTHFVSIAAMVIDQNVTPNGWVYNLANQTNISIWWTRFYISTINVGINTLRFEIGGTVPLSGISNPSIILGYNSYPGTIVGNQIVFELSNYGTNFSPGGYNLGVNVDIASCTSGDLTLSLVSQGNVKYHNTQSPWQLYTPSGTFPIRSDMTIMKCFTYKILKENTGTNAHYGKWVLENVPFSSSDPNPLSLIYLSDNTGNIVSVDTTKLAWNGNYYEGFSKFQNLQAESWFTWRIESTIDGLIYNQFSTIMSNFWFQTKTCYSAFKGETQTKNITSNSAIIEGRLQFPYPAGCTEFDASLYLKNEDMLNSYPSVDSSKTFVKIWKGLPAVTDTSFGSYFANTLDSCTNYSYWIEWKQPCGGILKSEVRHFRTTGKCNTDDAQLFIFPNPVKDFITIRFNYERDLNEAVEIFTPMGSKILTVSVKNSQQRIDVSNLPTGMYIIRTIRKTTNGFQKAVTGKFIKIR